MGTASAERDTFPDCENGGAASDIHDIQTQINN
jgi:hypothetical protein